MGLLLPLLMALVVQPPCTIVLSSKTPLAVLVLSPSGRSGRVRSSDLIRSLSEALEPHTNFAIAPADPGIGAECKGKLACIVSAIRPDRAAEPRYLLVLSDLTEEGQADLLLALLLDTDRVLEAQRRIDHHHTGWETELEAEIDSSAVLARSDRREVSDPFEAQRIIADWVAHQLQPIFTASGDWEPLGSLLIENAGLGSELRIDETTVGKGSDGPTHVCGLLAGKHSIKVERAGQESEALVAIEPNRTATLSLDPLASPDALRAGVRWGGVAVAAAGALVTVIALARNDDQPIYCGTARGALGTCPARGFQTVGYSAGTNPPGLLFAPLGYSLIALGGTSALGSALLDQEPAWLPLLAGLALGALSYGISAAVH